MHGHVSQHEFLNQVSGFLAGYYLALAAMNFVAAVYSRMSEGSRRGVRVLWLRLSFSAAPLCLLTALLFASLALIAFSRDPRLVSFLSIPQPARDAINVMMDPKWYIGGLCLILGVMFFFRRFFVRPMVAWTGLNLILLLMGLSLTDPDFAKIVAKPDNVAIVGMVFLLGYFTWLSAFRAVQNDGRAKEGLESMEKLDNEKVLVWPDLVYIELICMVALTAVLLVWGVTLQAPLEEPANPAVTPNPSKAPWYFVGLQEMLLYFDPWMAGVVLPGLILFGLMAIPYLDFNKKGNGYYTIDERKFAYVVFQFGFLGLWITFIVIGTFMRGPNWTCFGLYETWDVHKVEVLNNVSLSECFWIGLLGRARPIVPEDASVFLAFGHILYRELPGLVLLFLYFAVLPAALTRVSFFRNLFARMGAIRYVVMSSLLLMMALLPIKMICRWLFNLDYFIAIPEYMTNL